MRRSSGGELANFRNIAGAVAPVVLGGLADKGEIAEFGPMEEEPEPILAYRTQTDMFVTIES